MNDGMKLIIATFIGIVIGFFLGISFPTLSLTKVSFPSSKSLAFFCLFVLIFPLKTLYTQYVQINFASSILPSVNIAYVEDETPETSSETLLHTWSSRTPSLHGANASSHWKALFTSHLIFFLIWYRQDLVLRLNLDETLCRYGFHRIPEVQRC